MKRLRIYRTQRPRRAESRGNVLYWQRATAALEVPFRAPHHTVSRVGALGELARAAGGVLLLDDAQEFKADTLRQLIREWQSMGIMRPVLVMLFSEAPRGAMLNMLGTVLAEDTPEGAELRAVLESFERGAA